MTATVGKKLQDGKYILNRELGEGGFGLTYQAVDRVLDRVVVIKTFKSSSSKETELAEMRKQFLNEAQRLVQCYHPNIVRFYEFFIEDGAPYIVMDYIAGQTLHNIVLPDNPLPEATAIKYIRQIGEALKVVHSQGLLHRDIKPQNLILCQDNQQAILIDFGIAREFNQETIQTHTSVVSDGYAPIEQYLPKAKRTPATDIYGLAATLYTLVTAQIPISATLRNRIALDPPKDIKPELSARISAAIMQGLALEIEERPSSVEEWLNLLPQNEHNTDRNISSGSIKTVSLIKTDNKLANLSAVASLTKPIYRHRILPGLIAFAAIVWGLDYAWLRFKASSLKQKDRLNSVEQLSPTNSSVIPPEKLTPITPEATDNSNINTTTPVSPPEQISPEVNEDYTPTTNTATSASSPERVTPKSTQQSIPAAPTNTSTSVSSPNTVSPKPPRPSTPPKVPSKVVSPPRKTPPKPTIQPKSNRLPSIFVSPDRRGTPETNNPSNKNRVPSVFVSPDR